jgi:hypothetical protein
MLKTTKFCLDYPKAIVHIISRDSKWSSALIVPRCHSLVQLCSNLSHLLCSSVPFSHMCLRLSINLRRSPAVRVSRVFCEQSLASLSLNLQTVMLISPFRTAPASGELTSMPTKVGNPSHDVGLSTNCIIRF